MGKKIVKITLAWLVSFIATNESFKGCGMSKTFLMPNNKESRLLHIDICKKLAEISKKWGDFPMSLLVYFAIGKNAHRLPVFKEGYKKIFEEKAETILTWLKLFAKHNENEKLARNAVVAHALCRLYDVYCKNNGGKPLSTAKFKKLLANVPKNQKWDNFDAVATALGVGKETAAEETAAAEEVVTVGA